MSKRRGRGEGSVKQLGNGQWRAWISGGIGRDGKRHRPSIVTSTKQEALTWLRARQAEQAAGTLADAGKITVGQWLDRWLSSVKVASEPKLYDDLARTARLHLRPADAGGVKLESVRLDKLRPAHVGVVYEWLLAEGLTSATRSLAGKTLRRSLKAAVEWGMLARNPASAVPLPSRGDRPEINPWTAEEARAFLAANRSYRHYPLYVLALDGGMRQGEILGLHWPDLNLAAGTVRVHRTLRKYRGEFRLKDVKTRAGRRTIRLTPRTVEALAAMRDRDSAGPVFRSARTGEFVHYGSLRSAFALAIKRSGVRPIRFHDMRHTCATLLLLGGINVKAVSARLGHASPTITLEVYSHWIPEMDEQAVSILSHMLAD